MKNNRIVVHYEACGRMNVRPICANWKNGRSTPSKAVMVDDPEFEQLQHLLPEEAELLHGMCTGCTMLLLTKGSNQSAMAGTSM